MKWLTEKEIQAAAKKSKRAAINCAIKHWEQLAACSRDEVNVAIDNKQVSICAQHCALCIRYMKKRYPCPLKDTVCERGGCVQTWYNVLDATPKEWPKAAKAMLDKLKSLKTG